MKRRSKLSREEEQEEEEKEKSEIGEKKIFKRNVI